MLSQETSQIKKEMDQPRPENASIQELFSDRTLLEVAYCYWRPLSMGKAQPNLRGCKWSPDGTCCLCVVHRDGVRVMELPRDLYETCPSPERQVTPLSSVLRVAHGALTYDFCWYPKMNSYIPETCSWITAIQNSPIQMWDAYDGSLRCSYRGYNSVDEMEPALSVTFISGGARIVGGYKKDLKTFDVERPGRDFVQHKISTTAACFATTDRLLAVGCWNSSIKLFSISDMGTYKSAGNLHGHKGGVTHMQFTPDGTKLVSGARKDNKLLIWDIRYHRTPLNILQRCVSTNQRIYFDISPCGRYLVSGGTDGVLKIWDDKDVKWTGQFNANSSTQDKATFEFPIYEDCLNSVTIHPTLPILATGSGQYHNIDPLKMLEQEDDQDHGVGIELINTSDKHTQVYNVGGILVEKNTLDSFGIIKRQNVQSITHCELENDNDGDKCSSPTSHLPSDDICNTQLSAVKENIKEKDIMGSSHSFQIETQDDYYNVIDNNDKESPIKETCTGACETDSTVVAKVQTNLNNSSEKLFITEDITDPINIPVIEINEQECDDEPPAKKRALEAPNGFPISVPSKDVKSELINEYNSYTALSNIDLINIVNQTLPEKVTDKNGSSQTNIDNGLTVKNELLATNTLDDNIIRKKTSSDVQQIPVETNIIKETNNTELQLKSNNAVSNIDTINIANQKLPKEITDTNSSGEMNIDNGLTNTKELLATNSPDDNIRKNTLSVIKEIPKESNIIKESNNTEGHHVQPISEPNKKSQMPEESSDCKSTNLSEADPLSVKERLTLSVEKPPGEVQLKNNSYLVNDSTEVSSKNADVMVPGVQNCLTFWWIANIPQVRKYIE